MSASSMIILKQQVLEGSWTIFDAAYIVCYSFLLTLVSYLMLSHPTSFHFNGCLQRQLRLFFCITAWAHVHFASAYVLHSLLLKYVIVLRCLMSHCWVMCAFNMSIFMPYNCKLQVICQKIKNKHCSAYKSYVFLDVCLESRKTWLRFVKPL